MSLSCFPTNYLASIDCTNAEKNYFQEVTREGKAFSIMKSLLLLFNSGLSGSSLGSLLFLGILGEELLVAFGGLLGVGPACAGISLDHMLATETLLGDHTLDLGGLVDSLVSTFDFAGDNVSGNIILLLVKTESLDDVSATLGAKTVSTVDVGDTFDVLLALLDNSKEDSGNVGADNAATYGLALAVTVTTGNIARTAVLEEDACAGIDKDALLHLEALLVVTTGNTEDVALVSIVVHHFTSDFLSHSPVVEGSDEFFIINFNFLLSTSGGVRNVKLHSL
jgi:hypothetical protein